MIQSNQRSWKLTPQLVVYVLKFFLVFLKYLLERLKIKIGMYILCTHFLWLVVLTSILRPFSRLFPSCKTGWNYFKTSFSQHSRGSTTALGTRWPQGLRMACAHVFIWGVPTNPRTGLQPGPQAVSPVGWEFPGTTAPMRSGAEV